MEKRAGRRSRRFLTKNMAVTMIMGRIETANETWRHDRNDPNKLTVKFPKLPAIGVIESKIPRTDGSLKRKISEEKI